MWGECPDPQPDCREDYPYSDDHHLYYPGYEFTTPTEKQFRSLEVNIIRGICRCMHRRLHQEPPPPKPSIPEMRQIIEEHRAGPR